MSGNIVAIKPEVEAFKEAAKALGLNQKITNALVKRVEHPVNSTKKYSPDELLEQIDLKIALGLDYMDDLTFAGASLKELSLSLGILIDKRQILMGEPTEIVSVKELADLNALLPELLEECKRRGITIDMEDIEDTPIHHDDKEPVALLESQTGN